MTERLTIEEIDAQARTARVVLAEQDLLLLNNALNEVCFGIEIDPEEFATRLGVSRASALELLDAIGGLLDELGDGPPGS
jgi:hypothetical protein